MEEAILNKLEEIRILTLIGVKDVLSMNEAAIYLGISAQRLRTLASPKEREIPCSKVRGSLYFNKQDLNDYMSHNRRMSSYEIESQAELVIATSRR